MGRFKKEGNKGTPDLNMGSMSDIIFMFLFFFMVITTMRESSLFVTIQLPKATEVQKLQKKSLVVNINIGAPKDVAKLGNEPLSNGTTSLRMLKIFPNAWKEKRQTIRKTTGTNLPGH